MGSPRTGTKLTIRTDDPPLQVEGEIISHVYVIASGRAQVFMQDRLNPGSPPIACDRVCTGSLVGEDLLLSPIGVTPVARYTVRASKEESPCVVWRFTHAELMNRLQPDPEFASILLLHALEYRYWCWVDRRDVASAARKSGTRRVRGDDTELRLLEQRLARSEAACTFAQSANAVSVEYALRWVLQGIPIDPDDPLSSAIQKIRMLGEERAFAGQQIQRILDRIRKHLRADPFLKDAAHTLLQLFGVSGSSPGMPAVRPPPIPREDPSTASMVPDYEDLTDTKRENLG